ncbi:ATPase, AAA-type, core [Corchorus olitorius]|uniref:ATPase, AAA-type, core n=1 Tax=Corchorus olitorius TaxID=93759 RepID=A0A1R3IPY2_9ROSI|nr:ATPase, AAA-type, core [Corchorus olitorius]
MASTLNVLATFTIIRSTFNDFIPKEIREYLWSFIRRFSSDFTLVIEETHDGSSNHLFKAAMAYLGSHVLSASSASGSPKRLTVGKNENVRKFTFGLDRHSEIVDFFHGIPMKWKYNSDVNTANNNQFNSESRWYELSFQKKHAEMVKSKYLPHVISMAKKLKNQNRMVKFHTVRRERWSSSPVNLDHPMTFSTLAMDGDLKKTIVEDLDSFTNGKEYYKKIGKVWKRGYLLYGPPGTGKSSLIAAMANHLNFDIYNLNLSAVNSDSSLEFLLLHVSNRSILVIEDIDCTVKLQNREAGDEVGGFPHVQIIQEIHVSPAEVAGELMKCKDPDKSLENLIQFLENKASEGTSENTRPEGGTCNPKREKGSKSKNSTKSDVTNNSITFLALGSGSKIAGEYTVKAELAPILRGVLLKHGDILANCLLNSLQCRSSFLEIVCGIIQKLQVAKLEDLTEVELQSMVASVCDLESVKLELDWLHKRLDEVIEAVELVKHSSKLNEDKKKILQEIEQMEKELETNCHAEKPETQNKSLQIQEMKAETEKLSETISNTEAKVSHFQSSLVDGLL